MIKQVSQAQAKVKAAALSPAVTDTATSTPQPTSKDRLVIDPKVASELARRLKGQPSDLVKQVQHRTEGTPMEPMSDEEAKELERKMKEGSRPVDPYSELKDNADDLADQLFAVTVLLKSYHHDEGIDSNGGVSNVKLKKTDKPCVYRYEAILTENTFGGSMKYKVSGTIDLNQSPPTIKEDKRERDESLPSVKGAKRKLDEPLRSVPMGNGQE